MIEVRMDPFFKYGKLLRYKPECDQLSVILKPDVYKPFLIL